MTGSARLRTGAGLIAAVLVATMMVALGARRIWTVDYWWQWKTGEYIGQHGIPQTAFQSYTNPDHPRIELRWAYCLALYKTSEWFGRASAVVLKILCLLTTFALVAGISTRRDNMLIAAAVVAVGALAASQRFFVRPEVVSYLLLAVFLAVIERSRRGPTRWIWVLFPVEIVWVNVHTFFLIGPALVAIWLAAELLGVALDSWSGERDGDRPRRVRTAAVALGAVLAATLVNPYLYRALVVPLLQFRALHGTGMKGFYSELFSPFAMPRSFTALFYYKVLVGLAVLALLLGMIRARRACGARGVVGSAAAVIARDGFWIALLAIFFYLSAVSVRNVAMFCLVAIPFVVGRLTPVPRRDERAKGPAPALQLVALALLATFCGYQTFSLYTNRFNLRQGDSNQFGIGLARHRYPVKATEFLRGTGVDGPIFNSSEAGAYLLAHGYDVYIDPRGEVYQERLADEYQGIVRAPQSFPEQVRRYDFRICFLESDMFTLIAYLHRHPDWRIVYADSVTTLLLRSDTAPHIPAINLDDPRWLAEAERTLGDLEPYAGRSWLARLSSPKPHGKLGRLCLALQAHASARALLEASLAIYPHGFDAYEPLARAAAALGDHAAAAAYYAKAIRHAPDRRDLWLQRAYAQLRSGDGEAAREGVDGFLRDEPDNAEAMALRGEVSLALGRADEAAEWLERAIAVEPGNGRYHYYHAQIMFVLSRYDRAEQSLEAAFRVDPQNVQVAVGLAELHAALGRVDKALAWAERARGMAPGDPQVEAVYRRIAGP